MGQLELGQTAANPRMTGLNMYLHKVHVIFFLIVVEGFGDVLCRVDHVQFARNPGQQRALQGDGQQNDAENQIEQIVARARAAKHGKDCEYNGSRTAQTSPGYDADLAQGRAEG